MGGRGASYSRISSASKSRNLTSEQLKTLNYYKSRVENGQDISSLKNVEDIKLVSMAYDDAISDADKNLKLSDYYDDGRFLPYDLKTSLSNNSQDHYLINNGFMGSFKKISESKKTVTYMSSKGMHLKINKEDFIKDRINSYRKNKANALSNLQTEALYKLAKSNKLKATRRMSTAQLKGLIQENAKVRQKAVDLGIWSIKKD